MAQINLLVHGNPTGFDAWYNSQELKGTETEFLRSLYSGTKSAEPTFLVKLRQEGASYVTYYHYLITQGVQEASGRASGYIGLSLRIGGAISFDLQQIYALLDGLFRQQAVGTLVDKTNNGYRFQVGELSQLGKTFLEWESKIAQLFSFTCSMSSPQLAPAQEAKTSPFALADLTEQSFIQHWEKYLLAGNSLRFSVDSPSQRAKKTEEELRTQVASFQQEANKLQADLVETQGRLSQATSSGNQASQQVRELSNELEKCKHQLQLILNIAQGKNLTPASGAEEVAPKPETRGGKKGKEGRNLGLPNRNPSASSIASLNVTYEKRQEDQEPEGRKHGGFVPGLGSGIVKLVLILLVLLLGIWAIFYFMWGNSSSAPETNSYSPEVVVTPAQAPVVSPTEEAHPVQAPKSF